MNMLTRGVGAGSNNVLSVLRDDIIQANSSRSSGYHASTLQSYPIMVPEETYGTLAVPRGPRCILNDGTNDFATLGARITSGSPDTVCAFAWIKTSTTGVSQNVITEFSGASNRIWGLSLNSSGVLRVILSADGTNSAKDYTTTATVNTGSWVHVGFTFASGVLTLYINGVAAAVTKSIDLATTTLFNTASAPLSIATSGSSASAVFNGHMRDARVYNVNKTAAEVLAIKNQADTPTTLDRTGLLGGWWLNEERGTRANDWSGNGKHLTYTNITESTFHATDAGVTWNPANWLGHTKAMEFNGSTSSSTLGTRLTTGSPTALTACCWFKTSLTADGMLLCEYKQGTISWGIYMYGATGFLNAVVSATGAANTKDYRSTVAYNDGAWHHVAFVFGSSTLTMYVDGVAITPTKFADGAVSSIFDSASPFTVGCLTSSGGTPTARFNGSLLDGRVYNVAKSAAEILAIKNGSADTTGLLARYYDQYDISGNGKNLLPTAVTTSIIPRNEASPTLDAAGSLLNITGPVSRPVTTEVPCVTFDGTAVYADLGTINLGTSHTATIRVLYTVSSGSLLVGGATGSYLFYYDGTSLFYGAASGAFISVPVTLATNTWYQLSVVRSGTTVTLYKDGTVVGTPQTLSSNAALTVSRLSGYTANTFLLNGRLADFSYTIGGVTKTYPLQDGPGTGSTNRNLSWVGSDGTGGTINNALVGGTVSTIWANRCPYAQDHCLKYGGRLTNQNALLQSSNFATTWSPNSTTITVDQVADPIDGTVTADKLANSNVGSVVPNIRQDFAGTAGTYTISVYAKANTVNFLMLGTFDGTNKFSGFNLSTGTVDLTAAGHTLAITSVGGGWYRCSLTYYYPTTFAVYIGFYKTTGTPTYAPASVGADSIYICRAQASRNALQEFEATTTAAVDGNVFIPGRIGASTDAGGVTKTLTAGKFGNPGSRRIPNLWSAPELTAIGLTSTSTLEDLPVATFGASIYGTLGARLPTGNPTALTMSVWVKPTSASGNYAIAGEHGASNNSYSMFFEGGFLVAALSGNGTTTSYSKVAWSSTSYNHVAFVYNGSTVLIYVNGVSQAATLAGSVPASLYASALGFYVGRFSGGGYLLDGPLYDLRVYNVAKTAAQIATIMSGAIDDTGILGHWIMDEGSGSTLFDASSNGKDLTLSGTLTSFWTNKVYRSLAPKALRGIITRFTKWGRSKADGNDRYMATKSALTGESINRASRFVE